MAGLFVSYRRDDSQGFAGRLANDLSEMLGPDRVFRDIEIPPGSDFTDVLQRAIAAADVLLVVIGRRWAADSYQGYKSRLFEPTDWVRTEIEAAFSQGKQIVPVLVGGASMPQPHSLPESIGGLIRLQAATLTDRHWETGVSDLAERLLAICPSLARNDLMTANPSESPAEVLRAIGDRLLDEVGSSRRSGVEQYRVLAHLRSRLVKSFGRWLSGVLKLAVMLCLIYAGIRLFGDESMLRFLDALEARLLMGWQRMLIYFRQM